MKILFLDDNENRQIHFYSEWSKNKKSEDLLFQTRTAKETIEVLKNESPFDVLSLDHDLGGKVFVKEVEETGYQVALFIENELAEKLLPSAVVIHSHNPAGSNRMRQALSKRNIKIYNIPYSVVQ